MKIVVQNPYFLFGVQEKNFNGYDFEFVRQFQPTLFFQPSQYNHYLKRKIYELILRRKVDDLRRRLGLSEGVLNVVFSQEELKKFDVLICFNGRSDLPHQAPPVAFPGLKVFHVMDYVFSARTAYGALKHGKADYVMGYADHGRFCPFFRHYYPSFVGKIITVPFGFGRRFENSVAFEKRRMKVIALGSVNPVDDPAVEDKSLLAEYCGFYRNNQWTHQWRRMLSEHLVRLAPVLDSMLPVYPQTKDFSYDPVERLNQYAMFANDEGLLAFPPARTYEGVATGAVLVCADHPCYADIGFVDGLNCIMHRVLDLDDFEYKVSCYLDQPERLRDIALAGTSMVRGRFTHQHVAKKLYDDILKKWRTG